MQPPAMMFGSDGQNWKHRTSSGHSSCNCNANSGQTESGLNSSSAEHTVICTKSHISFMLKPSAEILKLHSGVLGFCFYLKWCTTESFYLHWSYHLHLKLSVYTVRMNLFYIHDNRMPLTELQTINEVIWPALHIFKAIFVYFVLYMLFTYCTVLWYT